MKNVKKHSFKTVKGKMSAGMVVGSKWLTLARSLVRVRVPVKAR